MHHTVMSMIKSVHVRIFTILRLIFFFSNKDANTDAKVQCRKSISKFLEREAASSCSQNR